MSTVTDRLPMADMQYPSCGVCGGDTYHDGDSLRCDDCRLAFDSNSLEAEYADEEDAACGAACANFWHDDNMIRSGWGYDCGTCILPAGHTSDHYTGCDAKEIALWPRSTTSKRSPDRSAAPCGADPATSTGHDSS